MSTWAVIGYAAVCAGLAAVWAWSAGYRDGLARGRREADANAANALGWMRVAAAAERRADEAEALLNLDFRARGQI
jgi:hypothetical protein